MPQDTQPQDTQKLAEFLVFSQRPFLMGLNTELEKHGLEFRGFPLLFTICNHPGKTIPVLAKMINRSHFETATILDYLLKEDFVKSEFHQARDVEIRPTNKGVEASKAVARKIASFLQKDSPGAE